MFVWGYIQMWTCPGVLTFDTGSIMWDDTHNPLKKYLVALRVL